MEEQLKIDRRHNHRVSRPLSVLVFWTGMSGRHAADMCDISLEGCYLNTPGTADEGEQVTVEIPESSTSRAVVRISGTVILQHRKHVGFALHFESQTDQKKAFIASLMSGAPEVEDHRG